MTSEEMGVGAQVVDQDALELLERLLVEDHRVEIVIEGKLLPRVREAKASLTTAEAALSSAKAKTAAEWIKPAAFEKCGWTSNSRSTRTG